MSKAAKKKTAKRARAPARAGGQAALSRRLARLEKQWLDGWQAPYAALRLCLTAGIYPPQWAHDAIMRFFTEIRIDGPVTCTTPRPLTAPGKTRIRAHIADRLMQRMHCDTGAAAEAAIEAMREVAAWDNGPAAVARVRKEMQKLVKDNGRAIHYPPDWDEHALAALRKPGKNRR